MATIEGYQSIEVSSLTPHIGAEVSGVDLRQPLSNEQFSEIYRAWLDWQVLVFREQDIDRDQHKSFARKFGTLHVHPMQHSYGGDPEILTVKTTKDSAYTAGNAWHTDVTCDAIPPMASMLLIKEPPVNGGGDTMFANMYLDTLDLHRDETLLLLPRTYLNVFVDSRISYWIMFAQVRKESTTNRSIYLQSRKCMLLQAPLHTANVPRIVHGLFEGSFVATLECLPTQLCNALQSWYNHPGLFLLSGSVHSDESVILGGSRRKLIG